MRLRNRLVVFLVLGVSAVSISAGAPAFGQAVPEPSRPTDFETAQVAAPEATIAARQSVLQRPQPDYNAIPLQVGAFDVSPSLGLIGDYTSNVYAQESNQKSDFRATLRPEVVVTSNWNNNLIGFDVFGEIVRYSKYVSENISNVGVSANGRIDIHDMEYIQARLGFLDTHEDRSSPDEIASNTRNPVEYQLSTADVGYVHDQGIVGLRVQASIDKYDYMNALSAGTSGVVNETDRSRTTVNFGPRVSYEFIPGYHAFVAALGDIRIYDHTIDQTGYKRGSSGYQLQAGTAVGLSEVLNGEVFLGYLDQNYDDPRFKTNSGLALGGNALWNISEVTSLRAILTRQIEETTFQPASGFTDTAFTLALEHEFRRGIFGFVNAGYSNQDYKGIARTDDQYTAGGGVRYLINRHFTAEVDVDYVNHTSNAAQQSYDREVVSFRLRAAI